MPSDPPYEEIIADLNEKSGKKFRHKSKATRESINGRWAEGFTLEDFQYVHTIKCKEWLGTSFAKFLRPETLYRPSHFEGYVNQDPETPLSDAANKTLDSCRQAAQEIFDDSKDEGKE